jgi:hypothetical protein
VQALWEGLARNPATGLWSGGARPRLDPALWSPSVPRWLGVRHVRAWERARALLDAQLEAPHDVCEGGTTDGGRDETAARALGLLIECGALVRDPARPGVLTSRVQPNPPAAP